MWTRNYNNIINTMLTNISNGYSGASFHPFDDSYTGNFKNTAGTIYEIATYNSNNNYSRYRTYAAFVRRTSGSELKSGAQLLTNIQGKVYGYPNTDSEGTLLVAFGKSDDDESYEDYMIEDVITSFILNSGTSTITENADGTLTIDYRIMFTATDEIEVKEIGLFLPVFYVGANNSNDCYYALINRMVLDTPITAVKDEVVHVNFSITTPKISIA